MSYIGNPIIRTVAYGSITTSGTFHRKVLEIQITDSESAFATQTYKRYQPVSAKDEQVVFDLAPSFRAFASQYQYSALSDNAHYPTFVAKVVTYDEYMLDCVVHTANRSAETVVNGELGKFTDFELMHTNTPGTLTLKPSAGELLFAGTKALLPHVVTDAKAETYEGAKTGDRLTKVISIATTEANKARTFGTRTVYVIPKGDDAMQFQFVNTRGFMESAFAICRATDSLSVSDEVFVRSVRETTTRTSRRLTVKKPSTPKIACSSGFVNEAWARWWSYEFCCASQHWVLLDGIWVPCSVSIKDGFTIINRSKKELLSVQFDVTPDVYGMLYR